MKYQSGGKDYVYAVDAVNGKMQIGTRPLTGTEKVVQFVLTTVGGLGIFYVGILQILPFIKSFF